MGSGVAGDEPASEVARMTLGDETAEIARVVAEAAPEAEKIPAAERVYAYVKAAILDRVYPGGELLTEGELATAVGVSRTPVREALLRLEESGLVKLYPKRGALVLPVLPQEIEDVLEARELIETHAAAKVWPRRKQLIAALTEKVEEMRAHRKAGDAKSFLEADRAFHEAIVGAAGNEILAKLYNSLRDRQVRMGVPGIEVQPARMDKSIGAHQEMIDALGGNSVKRFRELVVAHIKVAATDLRGAR
ncbi:DNA-binding GntR family transcriptional regulator [Kribbella sp. VKM Ac-2527]|uniref:DNA-binding GntR family transcriptional regulator n=1 Tax=Kribbella caucasensis TaxID=2512215 RepID=A0A4R6KPM1_9ACTN|nr:GntR family transcriptional regulator [Kribbella sp. VKM Ac-2527]TDO54626.1 DNA-binding GntR family transcriptional regulator [Kribbella sp. VKM Ac-2527]